MRPHFPAVSAAARKPRPDTTESPSPPELFLVCEAWSTSLTDGRWRFSIDSADGTPVLEAADEEPGDLNRLTLLAAVRGLEAIDGPASVMLLSTNRYLIRSLADSLPRWRANDFAWEHFGRVIDIQHADLWRRIDRALRIHRVEACLITSRLVSSGQFGDSPRSSRRPVPPATRLPATRSIAAAPTAAASTAAASTAAAPTAAAGVAEADEEAVRLRVDRSHRPAQLSSSSSIPIAAGSRRRGSGRHRFTAADLLEAP